MTSTTIRVGDLDFTVRETGPATGAPVLALHGFPTTQLSWAATAALLAAAGRRVITLDQRGYSSGARPLEVSEYDLDHLTADVSGLLDALELPTVDLVGHDWGAIVAWSVAGHRPDRVTSLTALSVPHPVAFDAALATNEVQQRASAYIGFFQKPGDAEDRFLADGGRVFRETFGAEVPAELVDSYLAHLSEPGALTAALNWYRADLGQLRRVPNVEVPTTFIWGAQDPAIRDASARACGEYITGAYRFVELPEQGHWLPELAPELIAAEVARAR